MLILLTEMGTSKKKEGQQFSCPGHEEVDTKIIYQIYQVQEDNNIIIKYSYRHISNYVQ